MSEVAEAVLAIWLMIGAVLFFIFTIAYENSRRATLYLFAWPAVLLLIIGFGLADEWERLSS